MCQYESINQSINQLKVNRDHLVSVLSADSGTPWTERSRPSSTSWLVGRRNCIAVYTRPGAPGTTTHFTRAEKGNDFRMMTEQRLTLTTIEVMITLKTSMMMMMMTTTTMIMIFLVVILA